ncbi:hypothetical protein AWB67_07165 [Caballeronia terrestris]|uniref:Uncharacterized protein n=1 Tax=Caballeronia terrestris TaxID=1226301 RepID=A0A158KYX0_9BURK|nr:hypothetical protein AWB67_07165 [Caballeronia terrestris]
MQLLAHFLADTMQRVPATRADRLVLGQIVFDTLARQMRRQWLAAARAGRGRVGIGQSSIGQLRQFAVIFRGLRFGDLLSLVEHTILAPLAFWREALGKREAVLLLERLDAPGQFVDPGVTFGNALRVSDRARLEFVDVGPGGRWQSEWIGCFHTLHNSESAVPHRYCRFGRRRTASMSMLSSSQWSCSVVSSITVCCRFRGQN